MCSVRTHISAPIQLHHPPPPPPVSTPFTPILIYYSFQLINISRKMNLFFAYFRPPYTISAVFISSLLYWRCIITLRQSLANKRRKLLTFAFAMNLFSWVLTVVPHLLFIDFVMRGVQLYLPGFFYVNHAHSRSNDGWSYYEDDDYFNEGRAQNNNNNNNCNNINNQGSPINRFQCNYEMFYSKR